MSAYRVDGRVGVVMSPGIWRVLDDRGRVVGYGTEAEDAARIARALAVLDAMEERDTQITEAMQAMAEDEPAVPARGEAEP